MDLSLYSAQGSNSSERVEWALNFKCIPYSRIEVSHQELTSSYLNINPYGYVPCIDIDGRLIAESMAIIECIEELFPEKRLLGHSVFQRAQVREICEYVNSSIHAPQNRTVLKAIRPDLNDATKRKLRGEWIERCLEKLQQRLWKESHFAVGAAFSLADIFVASIYKKAIWHGADELALYDGHLAWLREHPDIANSEPTYSGS
ncbi:MAG: hypothetical protein CENE_00606 [Candidatus Celerinatantimonas neptuna]|nr:MAG: hypothetical protein CENE_00606 [Candidatus Celerinatantimonas neptuna]